MLSSDRDTTFSDGNSALPIGGRDCWPNISLRRSADLFVGPTFLSADRRSALSAGNLAFPIGGPLCRPGKPPSRSAEDFVGVTFVSSDRRTSMLARHLPPAIERRHWWRDFRTNFLEKGRKPPMVEAPLDRMLPLKKIGKF
jgi:hypothetical protein